MTPSRWALISLLFLGVSCAAEPVLDAGKPLLQSGLEGIDLSHHNGLVDWEALNKEGVEFIYLKATEGRDWKDPLFQTHWQAALSNGYYTGAYHFYLLCKPGQAQADNFIQSVGVRTDTLPPAIDLEYAENCVPEGDRASVLGELKIYLDAVEAEYGQRPVIYTTPDFYADWVVGNFEDYPIWIRSLSGPPVIDAAIWQYAMDGRLAGIGGPVDRNRVP